MRFTIDFTPASPDGGVRVYLDGVLLGVHAAPAQGAEQAAAEMHRRYTDAAVASHQHAVGGDCTICDGSGVDYLGRTCHRLVASR